VDAFGDKTYGRCFYDSITKEELNYYYLKKQLQVPPEVRYQRIKENSFFHESSWSRRGLKRYDCHHRLRAETLFPFFFPLSFSLTKRLSVSRNAREIEKCKILKLSSFKRSGNAESRSTTRYLSSSVSNVN
jgi:hypothetical protein